MNPRDNEREFGAMLRRGLASGAAAAEAECLDAGLLAAYYERSLTADEIRACDAARLELRALPQPACGAGARGTGARGRRRERMVMDLGLALAGAGDGGTDDFYCVGERAPVVCGAAESRCAYGCAESRAGAGDWDAGGGTSAAAIFCANPSEGCAICGLKPETACSRKEERNRAIIEFRSGSCG